MLCGRSQGWSLSNAEALRALSFTSNAMHLMMGSSFAAALHFMNE
jgi:hypothetical protein